MSAAPAARAPTPEQTRRHHSWRHVSRGSCAHPVGLGPVGSLQGAAEITIELGSAGLTARRLVFDARPILLGCPAGLCIVSDYGRTNDDQQLGAIDLVVFGTECC